jgi:hypothetical protein
MRFSSASQQVVSLLICSFVLAVADDAVSTTTLDDRYYDAGDDVPRDNFLTDYEFLSKVLSSSSSPATVTKLYANDGVTGAQFGLQIATNVKSEVIFVSSKSTDVVAGKVYVFQVEGNNTSVEETDDDDDNDDGYDVETFGNYSKVMPLQGSFFSCANDEFGSSIATPMYSITAADTDIDDHDDHDAPGSGAAASLSVPPLLYVGAPASDRYGPETGEVFLFTIPELPLSNHLPCPVVSTKPPDHIIHPHARFGSVMASFESLLIVGAPETWDPSATIPVPNPPLPPPAAPLVPGTQTNSGAAFLFECLGPKYVDPSLNSVCVVAH